jgi:adenosine deaminase
MLERSLSECFEIFELIHALVDTAPVLKRVTREVLEDFAADGVCYVELRTTPRALKDGTATHDDLSFRRGSCCRACPNLVPPTPFPHPHPQRGIPLSNLSIPSPRVRACAFAAVLLRSAASCLATHGPEGTDAAGYVEAVLSELRAFHCTPAGDSGDAAIDFDPATGAFHAVVATPGADAAAAASAPAAATSAPPARSSRRPGRRPTSARLILSIDRAQGPTQAAAVAALAHDGAGSGHPGLVVGLDLSGDPTKGCAVESLAAALADARAAGLPLTVHCGEVRQYSLVGWFFSGGGGGGFDFSRSLPFGVSAIHSPAACICGSMCGMRGCRWPGKALRWTRCWPSSRNDSATPSTSRPPR